MGRQQHIPPARYHILQHRQKSTVPRKDAMHFAKYGRRVARMVEAPERQRRVKCAVAKRQLLPHSADETWRWWKTRKIRGPGCPVKRKPTQRRGPGRIDHGPGGKGPPG